MLDYSKFAFTLLLAMMRKTLHTRDYAAFLELLIELRHRAGLTQTELGQRLPFEQPAISKIERGERRVDVIELKMICERLGLSLQDFVVELQDRLAKRKS
jgi:transcriptional regulator with XRE-family HTH domain